MTGAYRQFSRLRVTRTIALVGALALSATGCAWLERSSVPTTPPALWTSHGNATNPSISASGRYVVFTSDDTTLTTTDTNQFSDVFVRDTVAKTTELISATPAGTSASAPSRSVGISDDGRYVMFNSAASDLVANDFDEQPDAFIRDRQTNTTTLVSLAADGGQLFGSVNGLAMSGDGTTIAISTRIAGPLPFPVSGPLTIRRLDTGVVTVMPNLHDATLLGVVRLSSDGNRVAYTDGTFPGTTMVSGAVVDTGSSTVLNDLGTHPFEFSDAAAFSIDISSDGTTYAFTESHDHFDGASTGSVSIGKVSSADPPTVTIYGWTRDARLNANGSVLALQTLVHGDQVIAIDDGTSPLVIVSADARRANIAHDVLAFDLSSDGAWVSFATQTPLDGGDAFSSAVYTRSVAQSLAPPR